MVHKDTGGKESPVSRLRPPVLSFSSTCTDHRLEEELFEELNE